MSTNTTTNTPASLPLTSDELASLESLLPLANESELQTLQNLLTAPSSTVITDIIRPTRRQAEVLRILADEIFFGGAAGPGKSLLLIMWLAEGVHIPGYSAIGFRRTSPQLRAADGLIAKSQSLYRALGGDWHDQRMQWTFPCGATIKFNHLQHENSVQDHLGPSYHRIGYDELTQFSESQYVFLLGRLRKAIGFPLPVGTLATSNPGGVGHNWVKRRFVTQEAINAIEGLTWRDPSPPGTVFYKSEKVAGFEPLTQAFAPGRLADNPFIDMNDYVRRLAHQSPANRARMMNGDWSVSENNRISPEWLRYYQWAGEQYRLLTKERNVLAIIHPSELQRFGIVDCAATSEEEARKKRGKPPSKSVVTTLDFDRRRGFLMIRDIQKGLWDIVQICEQTREAFRVQRHDWLGVEDEKTGKDLVRLLGNLPLRLISHEGKGKVERFNRAANMLSQGRIYIDETAPWREDFEAELLSWTGDPDEPFDQGDTIGYAAREADWDDSGPAMIAPGGFSIKRRL